MRRRDVENDNGNRLIYYEFDDEASGDEAQGVETEGDDPGRGGDDV
ncbi:hypothetical protein ACFQMA_11180 [Halosimplex aquaticum]|uniref:Uncharacterized protein n=1 Tax=Halosimplex aquaticum TaxID=3026162 RepID=A0ABD5XZ74_9EURY|nr:hypothetical protein [Halosimplex aquaticum]